MSKAGDCSRWSKEESPAESGDGPRLDQPDLEDLVERLLVAMMEFGNDEPAAIQWLEKTCPDNAQMRDVAFRMWKRLRDHREERTQSLLGEHASIPPDVLDTASDIPGAGSDAHPIPEIPGHTILRCIASGGMGSVYEAEQRYPRRRVAIKLVRTDRVTEQLLRRFEFETHMLARLQHPGIAHVFEAGVMERHGQQQPYFVMEYIEGEMLTEFADINHLSLRERLALMTKICDGVEHAHQKGIIHRDLKPANILVTRDGQPKILDFGVARATDADIQITTIQTDIGALIGTLPYMSPEQAAGDPDDVDTRSDVYALGVIAYELLTGQLPYPVRDKMIHEAVRIIREEDPSPLSSLNRTCRGDVETIIAKALEKDKERRYNAASELAADIDRYLNDEPISARPPTSWYQIRKFARRNRPFVAGLAAAFAALALGLVGTLVFATKEAHQRRVVESQKSDLEAITEFQSRILLELDPTQLGTVIFDQVELLLEESEHTKILRTGEKHVEVRIAQEIRDRINETDFARWLIGDVILKQATTILENEYSQAPRIEASLREATSNVYASLGLYNAAITESSRALNLRELQNDTSPVTLLKNRAALATLYFNSGNLLHAEQLVDSTLPDLREHADLTREYVQAQLIKSYVLLNVHRRPEEVVETRSKLLAFCTEEFGEGDALTLKVMDQYAQVLGWGWIRRLEDCEYYHRRALELAAIHLGEQHPQTIEYTNNVGVLMKGLKRFDESEALLLRSLKLHRNLYGDNHPDTALAYHNLGSLYTAMKRYDEALGYLQTALSATQQSLNDSHPYVVAIHTTLANAYVGAENREAAEHHVLSAWQGYVNCYGLHNRATVDWASTTAGFYEGWHGEQPDGQIESRAKEWRERWRELSRDLPADPEPEGP